MRISYLKGALTLTLLSCNLLNAQNNDKLKDIAKDYTYNTNNQINFVKLKEGYTINESSTEEFLNKMVLNSSEVTAKKIKTDIDNIGYTHTKFQLYYNTTAVNNAIIIVHSQNGKVVSVNGDLNVIQKPVNKVAINEQKGLELALNKVNAKAYKWENKAEENHLRQAYNKPDFTWYPKGDLILYTKENKAQKATVHYAYKYKVFADEPLYGANVIVDAQSGAILAEENLICTADVSSTANTKYSGVQTFTTDNVSAGNYRLRETGRGNGIETYNLNNTTTYTNTDFTYTNTVWPATAPIQTGTDAHWGAEKTYDYYKVNHNRNSIDGVGFKLLSYVHYSTNYNNAFWNGSYMTYGDGNGTTFTILTAIDVCGHEITHGLTNFTAGLGGGEAGALNEGFSDIFGTTIENFARPLQWDWKIGADITPSGNGIRNMSNPNLLSQPDTYLGTFWDPGGEVHTNDGPCIYWYYLLCQGGTGTNDNSNTYTVSGLGMATAAKIAFRALTVYFVPTTNYMAARGYAIQAAKDLYGDCSNEVVQTTNAWYAVGVGPAYSNVIGPNFSASATSFCSLPANINFNNTTANGITYTWDFGDGSAVSTTTNPAHTYTANGTYSVKLNATGCLSAKDSITKTSYITINVPNNPTTTNGSRCGTGAVNLSASGTSQLYWYATPTATGVPLTIGTTYTTPSISSNTNYYVVNTSTNAAIYGAPTSSAVGAGANYNTATAYDIFDVMQPCTLNTVIAYASTAGNRTIELRNSANAILTSTVINMAIGANTLTLNFALTPGTGYRLGLNAASAVNLYRNSAGAAASYNIGGLVNITGTSAATAGYFYFYYNWQVQKANCTSSPVAVTASVLAAPSLTATSAAICAGQNTNLTASGAVSYTWSTGGTSSVISVTPASTTTYSLTGSNGGACVSTITTAVTVNANPVVSVNSSTICVGSSANLTASGATTYSWNTGASTNNISVSPTANTSYTAYGYNGSCSGSAVSNVVVNPLPVVTVAATKTNACVTDGLIALTGTPAGGTYSGAGVAGSNFDPTTGVGNYTVSYSYTDPNGCIGSNNVNIIVAICTDIQMLGNGASLSVYPNPASEFFVVNTSAKTSDLTLKVIDATGKSVVDKTLMSNSEQIDISKLAKGIYLIEVKGHSEIIYRTKIVKQ